MFGGATLMTKSEDPVRRGRNRMDRVDRGEVARRVAGRTSLSQLASLLAVDVVFEVVGEALAQREDVTIVGFGRFTTKRRMARSGRNPRTGEALEIPEATVPVFKASKILRNAVDRD